MSQYDVRLAKTQEEREAIYQFRYKIYIEESKKFHIPADHERKMIYDEADDYTALYYCMDNGSMVSSVRAMRGTDGAFLSRDIDFFGIEAFDKHFPHRELAIVNRLVVDADYRHTPVTFYTMLATYLGGLEQGTKMCFITCDGWLLQKYQQFGFRTYGDPVDLGNGIKRYRLIIFLCDYAYHQKINSRFLPYLAPSLDDEGEYAHKVTELLGYQLSNGITPLSFKNKLKKTMYLASLYMKKATILPRTGGVAG